MNNDAPHNGRDQFFQWLAVDPVDGSENVIFCDRRADPDNRSYYMTLARSTDGGRTFQNYAWSTQPSDPKDVFTGDYMGIAAYGRKVWGIWARTATAEEQAAESVVPVSNAIDPSEDTAKPTAEKSGGESPTVTGPEKSPDKKSKKGLFVEVGLANFSAGPSPQ